MMIAFPTMKKFAEKERKEMRSKKERERRQEIISQTSAI